MKKFLALTMALCMLFALCACGQAAAPAAAPAADSAPAADAAPAAPAEVKKIGVAFPDRAVQRWVTEGQIIIDAMAKEGYSADVQYAEGDVQMQISQMENMISSGVDCLVVTAIDSGSLNNVLQLAADQGIPVICYDRLVTGTPNVDYYVTFDNVRVGEICTKTALERAGVADATPEDPIYVEIFTGDVADTNSHTYYKGVMNILQDYLDAGTVVVKSGQIDIDQIAITGWSQDNALARLEDIISGYYSDGTHLDAVIGPADVFTYAYVAAFESAGYTVGEDWPISCGQDGEVMAVKNILAGKTSFTSFRDGRVECGQLLPLVRAVLEGTEPEINDTTSFDNGVKVVPAYVCQTTIVDADNAVEVLVDGGFYTADQLGL